MESTVNEIIEKFILENPWKSHRTPTNKYIAKKTGKISYSDISVINPSKACKEKKIILPIPVPDYPVFEFQVYTNY